MDKATKRPFIKRTEQEKLDLIYQWEKSGLRIKTFCEQHQFSNSLFHGWLNKYRGNRKTVKVQKAFVPLQITASPGISPNTVSVYAEIITAKGNQVKLSRPVSNDYLPTFYPDPAAILTRYQH